MQRIRHDCLAAKQSSYNSTAVRVSSGLPSAAQLILCQVLHNMQSVCAPICSDVLLESFGQKKKKINEKTLLRGNTHGGCFQDMFRNLSTLVQSPRGVTDPHAPCEDILAISRHPTGPFTRSL